MLQKNISYDRLVRYKKELAMPNIKSAKKRVSVIARRREENRLVKSTMATMVKKYRLACLNDVNEAEAMLKDLISYIDSAKSKGVIHPNTASRKISRLTVMLNKAKATTPEAKEAEKVEEVVEAKVEEVEAPAKKTTRAKKTATKKAE